ncbi:MAG: hypothetical protein ACTHMS_03290 [Jatrophihabitans sp.]
MGIERALIGFETADFAEHDGYAAVVVPRAGVGVDYRPATR